MQKNNVTIIIPVYKDWSTLEKCINSLKKYVDKRHKVLLINDNSPEADELEGKIKNAISAELNFEYFRNDGNLGFVQTCNRGVFELDKTDNNILLLNSDTEVTENFLEEMNEVMELSEKHGVVCPRSNNATLLSIPFQSEFERTDIIEESYNGYQKIKPLLKKYSVIPTGVGFCMLVRRDLIKNFGLFDEIYGKGYNEENDFCSRINKFGYSVVMANHAFVFHFESKSFTTQQKNEQNIRNEKILKSRYPEYFTALDKYFTYRMDPLDYFSEIICGIYPKKRILFSLYNLPEAYNGTAEYGLSLLESFVVLFGEKYEITILTSKGGAKFHGLDKKYKNIIYNGDLKKSAKKFDITFVPSQIFDMELLILLNKHSLKIVFALQDIIAWRCKYLSKIEEDFVLDYSFLFSDGIVAISDFSKKDANDLLRGQGSISKKMPPIKTIYHGLKNGKNDSKTAVDGEMLKRHGLESGKYILVLGNHFAHKSLLETAKKIADFPYEIVFLGVNKDDLKNEVRSHKNTHCFMSGTLPHELMEALYANCSLLVFPSQYEGFGLPIINAIACGKKVIVFDNELNRELLENIPNAKKHVALFAYFEDLQKIIEQELKKTEEIKKDSYFRTWDDVARETEAFLAEISNETLNAERLENRWRTLTYVEHLSDEFEKQRKSRNSYLFGFLNTKKWQAKIKFATSSPDKFVKKYYRKYKYKIGKLFFPKK